MIELVFTRAGNIKCTYAKTQPQGTLTQKVSDATSWEMLCYHHPREHRFLLRTQSHLASCGCTFLTMPSSPLLVLQPCMFRKSFKIGKKKWLTGNCLQANIKESRGINYIQIRLIIGVHFQIPHGLVHVYTLDHSFMAFSVSFPSLSKLNSNQGLPPWTWRTQRF